MCAQKMQWSLLLASIVHTWWRKPAFKIEHQSKYETKKNKELGRG